MESVKTIAVLLAAELLLGAPHVDVLEGLYAQFSEFVSEEEPGWLVLHGSGLVANIVELVLR